MRGLFLLCNIFKIHFYLMAHGPTIQNKHASIQPKNNKQTKKSNRATSCHGHNFLTEITKRKMDFNGCGYSWFIFA